MAYTLEQSILWSQAQMGTYVPLTPQTGSEPAMTIANMVVAFMQNPPFCWPTNREENTSLVTTAGTSDYTLSIEDFGFLERVTLVDANGNPWNVERVLNSLVLNPNTQQQKRPDSVCVKLVAPGTSIAIRFVSMDAVYDGTLTYQKVPQLFTSTSQDWFTQCNIPDYYMDIFNNLFLAEALQVNDDARAGMYRQRGMAALLAKSEGLSEMTKLMLYHQAMLGDLQTLAAQLRTQQAQTARSV